MTILTRDIGLAWTSVIGKRCSVRLRATFVRPTLASLAGTRSFPITVRGVVGQSMAMHHILSSKRLAANFAVILDAIIMRRSMPQHMFVPLEHFAAKARIGRFRFWAVLASTPLRILWQRGGPHFRRLVLRLTRARVIVQARNWMQTVPGHIGPVIVGLFIAA